MDTLKIKHFCTVVETESLSKAAELLGISHPGLHKSLRALEDELQVRLTEPKGRGIAITAKGKDLYPLAKDVLANYEKLLHGSKYTESCLLKLGATEAFCLFLPNAILTEFKPSAIEVSFHERCPGDLEPQIAAGYLSLGVTHFPVSHLGVEHIKLGQIDFGLYSAKKTKFHKELVCIRPHSLFDLKERDHWREDLMPRKNTLRVNMLSMALDLAKNGHGCVFIPKILASHTNQRTHPNSVLHRIPLPPELEVKVSVYLIKRITEPLTKSEERLRTFIENLLRS